MRWTTRAPLLKLFEETGHLWIPKTDLLPPSPLPLPTPLRGVVVKYSRSPRARGTEFNVSGR